MTRKSGLLLILAPVGWLLIGASAVAQEPGAAQNRDVRQAERPAQNPKQAPSPEQLAAWVRQLDADEFLTRETAMLKLIEAGPPAVAALKSVLATGSLEASSRALFILRQIGAAADFDTTDEAWALLTELASRRESPTLARRAAATLAELTEQRSAVALAELEGLGAKVVRTQFGGLPIDETVLSLEIGDDFRGHEEDLRRLKWLREVPLLVFRGEKVTDGWIKRATLMPSLEELHLYQVRVTDDCLQPFAEQTAEGPNNVVRQIGIYYTPVGDKVLEPLVRLPLLSFVKLYGTKVTPEAAGKFQEKSGLARLDWRRGAFLGVGCVAVDGSCLISTVHEGSPAEKAGLMREDMIVRFGDVKVNSFESLTAEISKRDAGDVVEVEVLRRTFDEQGNQAARNVVTHVTLMQWEQDLAVRNGPRP